MAPLFLFAFISGLVTIFAPCIWPILPIVLSASATGGHRKPLGVTLGVIISFAVLTLSLSYIVRIIPFDPNVLRYFAAAIIGFLGLTLIVPALSRLTEGTVSRLSGKLRIGASSTSTGFISGFLVGLALGVVWAPCAGPILATIAALAATQKVNIDVILVTVFYVLGVGIPLFIFAALGRHIFTKTRGLSKYTGRIQQIFGVIMILTAFLIATNYDKVISAKLLDFIPSYSAFLNKIEGTKTVQKGLDSLKGKNSSLPIKTDTSGLFNADVPAADFIGITHWITEDGKPISISSLKGKVVLVDFWTYTCINCIRTLPYVTSWYDKYHDKGFVVVGIHTPEFEFEKNTANVENAMKQFGIHYPVGQDNDYATWNNYNNQYWPAEYLIDANGIVRRTHFGEGEYDQMEKAIQILLKEKGVKNVDMPLDSLKDQTPSGQISPETYLGSARMQYLYPDGAASNGTQSFVLNSKIPVNTFSYGGEWTINPENAVAGKNAQILYNFQADKVYIILRPVEGNSNGTVKVYLDGKLIDSSVAGLDVKDGVVTVDSDRLYNIVDLHGKTSQHILRLDFQTPGTSAFTFTFG